MKACPCARPAHTTCHECKRPLCVWHYSLSPRDRADRLRPVCFPECGNKFWAPLLQVRPTQGPGAA